MNYTAHVLKSLSHIRSEENCRDYILTSWRQTRLYWLRCTGTDWERVR